MGKSEVPKGRKHFVPLQLGYNPVSRDETTYTNCCALTPFSTVKTLSVPLFVGVNFIGGFDNREGAKK